MALTFNERLKILRTQYDINQGEMATRLGISQQNLSDIEHGRRKPCVCLVKRLCQQFGCTPDEARTWHVTAARANGFEV